MESQLPIFVYGTLMSGEPRHDLLAERSVEIVEAVMPGAVVHNLGPFPMLRPGSDQVLGQLVWLRPDHYESTLATLDTIEGTRRGLYRRERRSALLSGCGPVVAAWVYVGSEAIATQYPVIPHGDWRRR